MQSLMQRKKEEVKEVEEDKYPWLDDSDRKKIHDRW